MTPHASFDFAHAKSKDKITKWYYVITSSMTLILYYANLRVVICPAVAPTLGVMECGNMKY